MAVIRLPLPLRCDQPDTSRMASPDEQADRRDGSSGTRRARFPLSSSAAALRGVLVFGRIARVRRVVHIVRCAGFDSDAHVLHRGRVMRGPIGTSLGSGVACCRPSPDHRLATPLSPALPHPRIPAPQWRCCIRATMSPPGRPHQFQQRARPPSSRASRAGPSQVRILRLRPALCLERVAGWLGSTCVGLMHVAPAGVSRDHTCQPAPCLGDAA